MNDARRFAALRSQASTTGGTTVWSGPLVGVATGVDGTDGAAGGGALVHAPGSSVTTVVVGRFERANEINAWLSERECSAMPSRGAQSASHTASRACRHCQPRCINKPVAKEQTAISTPTWCLNVVDTSRSAKLHLIDPDLTERARCGTGIVDDTERVAICAAGTGQETLRF